MSRTNTHDQIFAAALKLFSEKGFNASSVQDITVAAGVPKGSFYNHFESKEALGAAIVDHYGSFSDWRDVLADRTLAPLERLRRYVNRINGLVIERDFQYGCLLGNLSAELADQSPLIRSRLAAIYKNWRGAIEAAITDGQADGSIGNNVSGAALAGFLLDAWEGATLRARVERSQEALDIFTEVAFGKILC